MNSHRSQVPDKKKQAMAKKILQSQGRNLKLVGGPVVTNTFGTLRLLSKFVCSGTALFTIHVLSNFMSGQSTKWSAYLRMFWSHISGLHWAFEQSGQTGPWFCPPPFPTVGNYVCDVVQQDLATQVFYWDHYKSLCRKTSLERGRFLRPEVGEYLAGHMHAQKVKNWKHKWFSRWSCFSNMFFLLSLLLPICSVQRVAQDSQRDGPSQSMDQFARRSFKTSLEQRLLQFSSLKPSEMV